MPRSPKRNLPSTPRTPTRSSHRRTHSSPTITEVGLPPPIPQADLTDVMAVPSAPSTPRAHGSLKRMRAPNTPSRMGEIDSPSEWDSDDETLYSLAPRVRGEIASPSTQTPRRKVVNAIDVVAPRSAKKRPTLQDRLAAATTKAPRKASVAPAPLKAVATTAPSAPVAMRSTPVSNKADKTGKGDTDAGKEKVVVCMRIKPTESDFATTAYDLTSTSLSLSETHPNVVRRGGKAGRSTEYTYNFDTIVQYPMQTPELYGTKIAPLVGKAMKGFNSTVFAYGQTGSGKSHTMSGTPSELGVIPCAVDGIFDSITADTERAFLLRVSYIEIYNESLRDLLNSKKGTLPDNEKPTIHTSKGTVSVQPLVEKIVSTPTDVMDLLERGNDNRKTGATDWNERSSRSHAVFTITIESRPRDSEGEDEIRVSKLTLIDLAGSEKAVSDMERRGEGKHINQSLLALREVINKLTEKGKRGHVPYRNSKLTHLLENVLGGDSNICVICTMSAEEHHCAETLETLKFAGRCSQVETKAKKNILLSSDQAVIRAKDMEIVGLKRQLEELSGRGPEGSSEQMAELADSVAAMEARKSKLQEQLAKLNAEILTSELPRSGVGLPISPPRKKRPRISDFTSLSSAALGMGGIGLGTPKKTVDRRAVSTMVRVMEDPELNAHEAMIGKLDPDMTFDSDVQISSLRRTIAAKDAEMAEQAKLLQEARTEAAQIPTLKSDLQRAEEKTFKDAAAHADELTDVQAELDSTRKELLEDIEDKNKRIDALETQVLDLRKSGEDLTIENRRELGKVQEALDTVTSERDALVLDLAKLRESHEKALVDLKGLHEDELAEVKENHCQDIANAKAVHTKELANMTATVQALNTQAEANSKSLEAVRGELNASLATAQGERDAAQADMASAFEQAKKAEADLDSFQRAAMARESDQISELRAKASKAAADLESYQRAAMARESEQVAALRKEIAKERDAREKESDAREKAESELKTVRGTLSKGEKDSADLQVQLKKTADANVALEAEKAELVAKLAKQATALEAAGGERETLSQQLAKLTAECDTHVADHKKVVHGLEEASKARETELSGTIVNLTAERDSHRADHEKAFADLGVAKNRLAESERAHADAAKQVQALHAGATVADSIRTELEAQRALFNEEKAKHAQLIEANAAVKSRVGEIETRFEACQAALKAEQVAHADTQAKLKVALARIAELERELEGERKARLDDEVRAAGDQDTAAEAHKAELAAAIAKCESYEAKLSDLAKTTNDTKKALEESEARFAALQAKSTKTESELRAGVDQARKLLLEGKAVSHALDAEKRARAEQAASVERIRAELAVEKEARNVAEVAANDAKKARGALANELDAANILLRNTKDDLDKTTEMLDQTRAELDTMAARLEPTKHADALASQVTLLQKEMDLVLKELNAMRAGRDRLAAELDSTTNMSSGASVDGSETLRSHETEEITQLGKVIDAQKALIEEQRNKIQRWSEELEKQRDIVRLLTQDSDSGIGSVASSTVDANSVVDGGSRSASPFRPGHVRSSQSMSNVPSPTSGRASPSTPKAHSRHGSMSTHTHIPSTFTARNLGLPSAPSPLPAHGKQYVNALRKARRITIEHDMDRLNETSRVNRIKSVFDSPEKDAGRVSRMKSMFDSSPVNDQDTGADQNMTPLKRNVTGAAGQAPWRRL